MIALAVFVVVVALGSVAYVAHKTLKDAFKDNNDGWRP